MSTQLKVGISTCPNDTFAFHGILSGAIPTPGYEFDIELLDIQQLNEKLFHSEFDLAKASFHAALLLADKMLVMPAGSALGFGVGPLLLSAPGIKLPSSDPEDFRGYVKSLDTKPVVLCPGEHTTATLLYQLFYAGSVEIRQVVFSDIMPMLQNGEADFGVCIHEGRFTWKEKQLGFVADLGEVWESQTKAALPLGGLLGSREMSLDDLSTINRFIRQSIEYGLANRDATIPTMRKYAQEFTDDVLMAHVDLYVNDWTIDLGDVGRRALGQLAMLATTNEIVPVSFEPLTILSN